MNDNHFSNAHSKEEVLVRQDCLKIQVLRASGQYPQ